ncbi:hypothetical protein M2357_000803 [Kerstersia gyiorum]|nr:hypothetical protein [Kerstersia gyiorum]
MHFGYILMRPKMWVHSPGRIFPHFSQENRNGNRRSKCVN